MKNPFVIKAYESRELFCDRNDELQLMLRNCINHTDMTLISQRRMGKTGLILRLFDEIATVHPDIRTIYVDIFSSRNIDDFIKLLAEATMRAFKPKTTMGEKLMAFIKTMRPQLSFDNITGEPQLMIAYQSPHEKEYTLRGLLEFLDNQGVQIIIAIDEFQQIRDYPEKNMEALLRTYIQQTRNLTFIYCGSKKHTMTDMFTNAKKPFYESTAFLYLSKLPIPVYSAFIKEKFALAGKTIDDDSIGFIIEWTKDHTYYTQRLCNEVFSLSGEAIGRKDIVTAIQTILDSERDRFQEIRRLVTRSQWKMLAAIAMEDSVSQITSAAFLSKYKISSGPTALRNIKALIDKELVLATTTENGTGYSVYNVFLSRFLANNIQHLRP
jgi:hypothetical protein